MEIEHQMAVGEEINAGTIILNYVRTVRNLVSVSTPSVRNITLKVQDVTNQEINLQQLSINQVTHSLNQATHSLNQATQPFNQVTHSPKQGNIKGCLQIPSMSKVKVISHH